MSVANKFVASNVRFSEESKSVYLLAEGANMSFPYTFWCKGLSAHLFFDMKLNRVLWINQNEMMVDSHTNPRYQCVVMEFRIENDSPRLSVSNFISQEHGVLEYIADDFKQKLASYTLDSIINS
jgi:hypothetical protein